MYTSFNNKPGLIYKQEVKALNIQNVKLFITYDNRINLLKTRRTNNNNHLNNDNHCTGAWLSTVTFKYGGVKLVWALPTLPKPGTVVWSNNRFKRPIKIDWTLDINAENKYNNKQYKIQRMFQHLKNFWQVFSITTISI